LKIQSHGPIETGGFLGKKKPLVGRHVERLEIVFMAVCVMLFNTRWGVM